jgi:predicted RNase H-like HicB family nuclease
MTRYLATVEYDAGEYWISFPGIQKAASHAKRPEDIVAHARNFLNRWAQNRAPLPASLDDAITDPKAPFKGTKLVIFEWEPPEGYRPLADMSEEEAEAEIARILRVGGDA